MTFTVVAVGKIKEKPLRSVADDYVKRLSHYVHVNEVEVRDDGQLAKAVPAGARLVCLDVLGTALTSSELARRIDIWRSHGKGDVAFLIGGAEGIPRALLDAADAKISLSSLTLPHRLARVILFEQLYRSMTILRGEPYAREG